jgi:hypothetical protein
VSIENRPRGPRDNETKSPPGLVSDVVHRLVRECHRPKERAIVVEPLVSVTQEIRSCLRSRLSVQLQFNISECGLEANAGRAGTGASRQ